MPTILDPQVDEELRKFFDLPTPLRQIDKDHLYSQHCKNYVANPFHVRREKVDILLSNLRGVDDVDLAIIVGSHVEYVALQIYDTLEELPHREYRPYGKVFSTENCILADDLNYRYLSDRKSEIYLTKHPDYVHEQVTACWGISSMEFSVECAKYARCALQTYLFLNYPQEFDRLVAISRPATLEFEGGETDMEPPQPER